VSAVDIDTRAQALVQLADAMLTEHGLTASGWSFAWNRRAGALGVCKYKTRTVELSRPFFDANDDDTALDTLAHEVAHALAGPHAGHGSEWRRWAVKLGATPQATTREAVRPPETIVWTGTCPVCSHTWSRARLAAGMHGRWHGTCGAGKATPIVWVRNSEVAR
jgi:predicted SprT family Zn-dependent metalloprotease